MNVGGTHTLQQDIKITSTHAEHDQLAGDGLAENSLGCYPNPMILRRLTFSVEDPYTPSLGNAGCRIPTSNHSCYQLVSADE